MSPCWRASSFEVNKKPFLILAGGLLALTAWHLYKQGQTPDTTDPADESPSALDTMDKIIQKAASLTGTWRPPAQYADMIAQAEARHGIPADMLARLLYQESRYRADIISGKTRSPVGALGIAQFMPATAAEMGINPLDPAQAIDGAARYLARLFSIFGNWSEALAAYNWGQGNVKRKGLAAAPAETRTYYTAILSDVNAANGSTYA